MVCYKHLQLQKPQPAVYLPAVVEAVDFACCFCSIPTFIVGTNYLPRHSASVITTPPKLGGGRGWYKTLAAVVNNVNSAHQYFYPLLRGVATQSVDGVCKRHWF